MLPNDEHLATLVKAFLSTSRFFRRFNNDNKRIKMRGVHVWVVEAVRP